MPILTIYFLGLLTWGFYNHFIKVRYMTWDPFEGTLFILIHLSIFCLTSTTHPIYVFFSLASDMYKVGLTLDVVPIFEGL